MISKSAVAVLPDKEQARSSAKRPSSVSARDCFSAQPAALSQLFDSVSEPIPPNTLFVPSDAAANVFFCFASVKRSVPSVLIFSVISVNLYFLPRLAFYFPRLPTRLEVFPFPPCPRVPDAPFYCFIRFRHDAVFIFLSFSPFGYTPPPWGGCDVIIYACGLVVKGLSAYRKKPFTVGLRFAAKRRTLARFKFCLLRYGVRSCPPR